MTTKVEKFGRAIMTVLAVAGLTFFLGWAWGDIVSFIAVNLGYSDKVINNPYVLSFWIRGLLDGILGAVICLLVARKFGLKIWRFAICGYISWPLTVSILTAYPFVRRDDKQNRYNYYALSLGGIFFVLYLFAAFIVWFANRIGFGSLSQ